MGLDNHLVSSGFLYYQSEICLSTPFRTLWKLRVSHFITITLVNVSHILCCFIHCFLKQIFQKTWVMSIIEVCISLIVHNQNINQRIWLTLTIIMVIKWDTYLSHGPALHVLHHIYTSVTLMFWYHVITWYYQNISWYNVPLFCK